MTADKIKVKWIVEIDVRGCRPVSLPRILVCGVLERMFSI